MKKFKIITFLLVTISFLKANTDISNENMLRSYLIKKDYKKVESFLQKSNDNCLITIKYLNKYNFIKLNSNIKELKNMANEICKFPKQINNNKKGQL